MEKPNYRLGIVKEQKETRILAGIVFRNKVGSIEEKTFCSCFLNPCNCHDDCKNEGAYSCDCNTECKCDSQCKHCRCVDNCRCDTEKCTCDTATCYYDDSCSIVHTPSSEPADCGEYSAR